MGVSFDIGAVDTPAYVVDRELLTRNLLILRDVKERAGCRVLLAQKAFSMFYFYPLIAHYLDGTTASGLYEAQLGHTRFGKETHIFSPAFRRGEFAQVTELCGHIVFNSLAQWREFGPAALAAGRSCGLRINPECSTQDNAIYDPCAPGSRLGVTRAQLQKYAEAVHRKPSGHVEHVGGKLNNISGSIDLKCDGLLYGLEGLEGLHFHTLCEQNADALETTLNAVESGFGEFLPRLKWLNLGGGHHITRDDYDREKLIALVRRIREKYGVEVYLEPGEAVALNAGFLVCNVIDIVENAGIINAILDASAACHMPDVLEMPYRPPLLGAGLPGEKPHTYRLAGPTCLAGDIIGDYSFDRPLSVGNRLVFMDMAIYSMVKNNTFNGMPLPTIYAAEHGALKLVKAFDYSDFEGRLS